MQDYYIAVVDQTQLCSEFDLGHSQIVISISDIPNRNFRFGNTHVRNVINIPNPTWDIPNQIWNMVRFGTLDTPNPTMFQINIDTFGSWLGFRHMIPNPTMSQINMVCLEHGQVWDTWCPKLTMLQTISMLIWDIVRFGTYDTKPDYVPN